MHPRGSNDSIDSNDSNLLLSLMHPKQTKIRARKKLKWGSKASIHRNKIPTIYHSYNFMG